MKLYLIVKRNRVCKAHIQDYKETSTTTVAEEEFSSTFAEETSKKGTEKLTTPTEKSAS